MQTTNTTDNNSTSDWPLGGGQANTADLHSPPHTEDFTALEEDTDRYGLLLLVKKVGRAMGFTPRLIALLDYYMAYTRDCDWERHSRPIVFQSVSRTALDLGVSERQIQKLEKRLFELGAIAWHDSGNHRRYGQRDPESGRLLYAFGVDLTPLASLKEELEQRLHEKQLYDNAWLQTKREISACRRRIRTAIDAIEQEEGACAVAVYEEQYDQIAVQLRTHLSLEHLRTLLNRHISLHSELAGRLGGSNRRDWKRPQQAATAKETAKRSCRSEQTFARNQYTIQQSISCSRTDSAFKKSVVETAAPRTADAALGAECISLQLAVGAASKRFTAYLPARPQWADIVDAADRLRPNLGISQASWGEACHALGRHRAAICVLVTDQAMERSTNPVREPAAYLQGMVKRGREGELRLLRSLHSLTK